MAWAHSKSRVYYGDQSAQLTQIRAVRPGCGGLVVSRASRPTLRRLNKAFAGFFRRVKTAKSGVKARVSTV